MTCLESVQTDEKYRVHCDGERLTTTEYFDALVRKYWNYVYHIIYRLVHNKEDAEDITQEVFVKVYLNFPRFQQRAAFSSWIYRIAITSTYDALEKGKKHRQTSILSDQTEGKQELLEVEPEGYILQKELRESINNILRDIGREKAHILVMRDIHHLSYKEIAAQLEVKPNTVKMRIHRARRSFQELFLGSDALLSL